jgi:23S rRNA pseudouridine2605 synthase
MTDQELQQQRKEKWGLTGQPLLTLEAARRFLESVGFCLMYPMRPAPLIPTFIGAWTGSEERLPTWQQAYADLRAQEATEIMVRLLRGRDAYEANLFEGNNGFLIAASIFPYFYALVGERNPRQAPTAGSRSAYSALDCAVYEIVRRGGPISKQKLMEAIGGGPSTTAVDRSLAELWSKLRITRVDYKPGEGAFWDVLYRWSPDAVREGIGLSVPEALSALLTKYLDCVIAADQQEVENFLGNFVPRSKIKDSVNALLAARELEFVHSGSRSLLRIVPSKEASSASRPAPLAPGRNK